MKLIYTSLLLILSLLACSQEEWRLFDEGSYFVKYPSNWEFTEDNLGASFIVLSSPDNEKDFFRENVNLLIQDLAGMNIGSWPISYYSFPIL